MGFVRMAFSGLRLRLLLLLLLACAPLVALMLHSAWEDRRRAQATWRQRARNLSQIARREEQEILDATRQLLLAISESASVRSLEPRRARRSLDELYQIYKRYGNLGLVTTNGDLVASVFPVAETNFSAQRFFVRALERRAFAVGSFPRSRTNDNPGLYFGCPVLDANGQPLAVVFSELDLGKVGRASEIPSHLPRGATWTEVDRSGTIITRYPRPERWFGKTIGDPWLVTNVFEQVNGVLEGSDPQGIPYFYGFTTTRSRFAAAEVATVLGTPRPMLFADADRNLRQNLTWLAIAAGFALVLGWIGSRLLILRPVRALVRSSARLASGDLSVRTGLTPSDDELGQLTLAFDQMAQALEQREQERQKASQKLQLLSHRLVEVQETERRQIARELHDEIGQSLTAAEMNLQAALQSPHAASLGKRLADSIEAVERVLEQVHDLSLNLRPSMLDDLGLEPALRWYTHRQAALTGMRAEFRSEPLEERLDSMIETGCFRVAQEALTNVVRHARAQAVSVELTHRDGHLHLSVRDDGVGFDVGLLRDKAVHGASLGLLSMEERTSLAGGGLQFSSAPGCGTEVHAWFPLTPGHDNSRSESNE
jgi:signal transduction histidine kinase